MSFKIYQIHEYGGEWEDSFDYIVGSYLSKEKAEVEKKRLEEEEDELLKCMECSVYFCTVDCELDGICGEEKCNEYRINKAKKHCDRYEPYTYEDKDGNDEIGCKNYDYKGDASWFKIEEVEVIE